METAKKPICEICKIRPTTTQASERYRDRKGISGYTFTSFCEPCWEEYTERERKREREEEQALASRKEKVDKMLKYVRELRSTEQVPIGYAIEKLLSNIRSVKQTGNSRRWHRRELLRDLSQDLQIVKVRNRYMCNKRRVDAMDFKLWAFRHWPDIDV
ncbi:hypothetical protein VTN77DRAFT_500 [Rasamsonia byssochlamydoides]|uniref:uncharacterized protein n=1 Tax=Rasamsonia byssochlamydoides TaxID=89139 RepID=UPI003743144E